MRHLHVGASSLSRPVKRTWLLRPAAREIQIALRGHQGSLCMLANARANGLLRTSGKRLFAPSSAPTPSPHHLTTPPPTLHTTSSSLIR